MLPVADTRLHVVDPQAARRPCSSCGSESTVIHVVTSAGAYAMPIILVALGVYIVAESGLL